MRAPWDCSANQITLRWTAVGCRSATKSRSGKKLGLSLSAEALPTTYRRTCHRSRSLCLAQDLPASLASTDPRSCFATSLPSGDLVQCANRVSCWCEPFWTAIDRSQCREELLSCGISKDKCGEIPGRKMSSLSTIRHEFTCLRKQRNLQAARYASLNCHPASRRMQP